jgi:O-antigen/teichoic acid export membrane protein
MRITNSFKNFAYGVSGQIVNNVLGFVLRTIFIQQLGLYYLGIGSLFTSILMIFSLAELGIGTAIFVFLFKPLAEKDEDQINALINFYQKIFRSIGITIAVVGLILLPFLEYIIKGETQVEHLNLIYLLFVANSSISYFFSYYRALITADQKEYVAFNNSNVFLFIQYLVQILILLLTSNYLLYLSITIVFSFISNFNLSILVKRRYPFLSERKKFNLDRTYKKRIFKGMLSMMSHKVGRVVLLGTDNILLASYVGVYWVGLYSNYLMIINIVNTLIHKVFASISASIGNLDEADGKEKGYKVFKTVIFVGFWLFGFAAISIFIIINPFINLWLGEKYLLDPQIVLVIVISLFLTGMSTITKDYVTLTKLFNITKYKPWFEVAINLSISIILVNEIGMIGVFIGTILSNLLTGFWVDPYVLYNHRFKRKVITYFVNYILHTFLVVLCGVITYFLASLYTNIIYLFVICAIIPNLIFFIVYRKSQEFLYIRNSAITLFENKKNIF